MPPPVATLRPLPSHRTGLPRLPASPFRRAVPTTPADRAGAGVDYFPARAAFPKWPEGRHPHCHFRGLLRLHSRYGPPDRSAAQGDLCQLQPSQLPDQAARQLPDLSTIIRVEPSSTVDSRLRGALPIADVARTGLARGPVPRREFALCQSRAPTTSQFGPDWYVTTASSATAPTRRVLPNVCCRGRAHLLQD